jgi:hypothetical protein
VAGEIVQAAKKVKTLPQKMVRVGAKSVRDPLQSAYLRDSGGDGRLSGLRNSGTFKASTSVRGTNDVRGRVTIGPGGMRGPASWLNSGARRSRVGRTRAKRTFDRVVDAELPVAARLMENLFDDAVR